MTGKNWLRLMAILLITISLPAFNCPAQDDGTEMLSRRNAK